MNVPAFTIKDDNGKELLSTKLSGGGMGKYLKAAASLRSVVPLARVFSKPLTEVSGARELALAVEQDVPIGEGKELSISAGAGAKLDDVARPAVDHRPGGAGHRLGQQPSTRHHGSGGEGPTQPALQE